MSSGIAYLGNSVTVQRNGYRPRLHGLIGEGRPQVNAGLGGVGSLACACVIDFLVLRHEPALCIVECSLGDVGGFTPDLERPAAIESILRALASHDIPTVLLHLPRGNVPLHRRETVLADYGRVATAYGVPEVSLWPDADGLDWDPWTDRVHLTDDGAQWAAEIIAARMPEPRVPALPGTQMHPRLPGSVIGVHDPRLTFDGPCSPSRVALSIPAVDVPVGGVATFSSDERAYGFLVMVGPDSGVATLTADGERSLVQCWDPGCTYERLQSVLAGGTTIRVEMTGLERAQVDCHGRPTSIEHSGTRLRVIGVLAETGTGTPRWWTEERGDG